MKTDTANLEMPSEGLLESIVDTVRRFSPEEQHDDIIVAKCRANK